MNPIAEKFLEAGAVKAADLKHRHTINFNIGKYNAKVPEGKSQFIDVMTARERAKNIKWRAIETLDQQLESFEKQFTSRGGKVIWAQDAVEACAEILKICKEKLKNTIKKTKKKTK